MMAGEFPAGYPAQARRLAAGVEPRAAARLNDRPASFGHHAPLVTGADP